MKEMLSTLSIYFEKSPEGKIGWDRVQEGKVKIIYSFDNLKMCINVRNIDSYFIKGV